MRAAIQIGFGQSEEVRPGIWEDVILERDYLAEVLQRTETFDVSGSVIPGYRTTTSVSVLSDGPLKVNYTDLRYVVFGGVRWTISSAVVQPPRLNLFIGEVYNGPTPSGTTDGP